MNIRYIFLILFISILSLKTTMCAQTYESGNGYDILFPSEVYYNQVKPEVTFTFQENLPMLSSDPNDDDSTIGGRAPVGNGCYFVALLSLIYAFCKRNTVQVKYKTKTTK